jgi:phosphate transport system protein
MKNLEHDLDTLQRDIIRLATTVEEAITGAIGSLIGRDETLAEEIIDGDAEIDSLSNAIEEECLRILALYQPVAKDLRRVSTVSMINMDLERMADLAGSIAGRAKAMMESPPIPVPARLSQMTDLVIAVVHQSVDAFVTMNAEQARRVIRKDDEIDDLNVTIIQELVALMKRSPAAIEPALSLFSAVRHLERIADHATNIAEDVVFLVEGNRIRHHPEAIEAD